MTPFRLVILFGSRARGTTTSRSDADIGVLADRPLTLKDRSSVARVFTKKLAVSEDVLDITDLWNAPPLLAYRVAQEGRLLLGTNADFTRFRVLAWKRYLDTAKFRRIRSQRIRHFAYAK